MLKQVCLLCVLFISFCFAQNTLTLTSNRQCSNNAQCILLFRCPSLLKKAVSRNPSFRREVQSHVCKFANKRMYVCCSDNTPAITKPTIISPIATKTVDKESLLPKDCGQPATDDRIFGGEIAPLGAYPWMVAIGYKVNRGSDITYECAGSIISSRYVLTAAHCVNKADIPGLELAELNLGDWDLENPNIDCEVTRLGRRCAPKPHLVVGFEEVIIHEDYNKRFKVSDDIALIRMDRHLDFKGGKALMTPVCIPTENFEPSHVSADRRPIAAGWGFTEHGNKSNILLRVEIPFAREQRCSEIYKERFTTSQICAGGEEGFDSCGGDSGGPLVLSGENGPPFQQIGIVSFGPSRCASADFPAIYTSVAKYRKWILNHLKP